MNTTSLDTTRLNNEARTSGSGYVSNLETDAVKRVVREGWESRLKEKGTNLAILNEHMEFMEKEFSINYGAICMPSMATHSKHMSRGELEAYVKLIETLAIGYKSRFGADFSSLMIVGASVLSKDLKTARKQFDVFLAHLSKVSGKYSNLMDKESRNIEALRLELARKESGILRFFRKREIMLLRSRMRARERRIGGFAKKKAKYDSIANGLKIRVLPNQSRKE